MNSMYGEGNAYWEDVGARKWVLERGVSKDSLNYRIISCESNWDPKVCNEEFGCIAGMGLWGFISGTWNETIVRMSKDDAYMPERCWAFISLPVMDDRVEAVFDGECNYLAGEWLLENDGDKHWSPYSGGCYLKFE